MSTTSQPPQNHDEPLVRVSGMHVRFGSHHVLRDLNFEVPRRQTLAVIGESGCGKTVLLKTLIGLIRPTRGTVQFDGRDLAKLSDRELTRQRARFGYVFQTAALFDSLTVAQNVAFPLREHGDQEPDEVREIIHKRLAEVGLPQSVVTRRPAQLSGGMRKRVGLARALAVNPEIVLYDEPTTGLDPIMSDVINELMRRTRDREHVTGIIVTHDMRTVEKVADRVIMLYPLARLQQDEPQILFDGTPEEIFACTDRRVSQFVRGEAGERITELVEGA